jgi:hypothetical protein
MVNQPDYLELASGGDASNTRTCFSFLGCGLPTSSEAGMDGFRKQDFEEARELLKRAGYDGRPIVLMQPTDLPLKGGSDGAERASITIGVGDGENPPEKAVAEIPLAVFWNVKKAD